jgi:hypothetical protein
MGVDEEGLRNVERVLGTATKKRHWGTNIATTIGLMIFGEAFSTG